MRNQLIPYHLSHNKTIKVKIFAFLFLFRGYVGGFQKSYVIFRDGMYKYVPFLTGVGGWSGKGHKYPYII